MLVSGDESEPVAISAIYGSNASGKTNVVWAHETNLPRAGLLQREEVWFTDQNRKGETTLYPLTDFNERGGESLDKIYLQGRYGAVPYVPRPPLYGSAKSDSNAEV